MSPPRVVVAAAYADMKGPECDGSGPFVMSRDGYVQAPVLVLAVGDRGC